MKIDALVHELYGLIPDVIALVQSNQTPSGENQPPSP